MAADQFTFWRKALANPKGIGYGDLLLSESPEPGYWRAKSKQGIYKPVVFWFSEADGSLNCLHGHDPVTDLNRMEHLWSFAGSNPIAVAVYKGWKETGQWPDLDPVVADQISRKGDNIGNIDPEVVLQDQIDAALAQLKEYQEVTSDEGATKAQGLRQRLLELAKEGTGQHKTEKAPHLVECQRIDSKWLPMCKDAQAGADRLRKAMSNWETTKLEKKRAEDRRKHDEEMAAAMQHAMPPPQPVETAPPPPSQIRPAYGKAASVRVKLVATAITDIDALFQRYKDSGEVYDLLLKLANFDIRDTGAKPPGVKIEEVADIR